MNATALLSRMFDRWYRRQVARQHLLDRVRLSGHSIDADPAPAMRAGRLEHTDHEGRPGPGTRLRD